MRHVNYVWPHAYIGISFILYCGGYSAPVQASLAINVLLIISETRVMEDNDDVSLVT